MSDPERIRLPLSRPSPDPAAPSITPSHNAQSPCNTAPEAIGNARRFQQTGSRDSIHTGSGRPEQFAPSSAQSQPNTTPQPQNSNRSTAFSSCTKTTRTTAISQPVSDKRHWSLRWPVASACKWKGASCKLLAVILSEAKDPENSIHHKSLEHLQQYLRLCLFAIALLAATH